MNEPHSQSEDDHTSQARLNGSETVYTADSTLTKRELFAAMAMQGLMAFPLNEDRDPSMEEWASRAVSAADALLKELAK